MKKHLALVAILSALCVAPFTAAHAEDAPAAQTEAMAPKTETTAETTKTEEVKTVKHTLTKEEKAACKKEANAKKDGKKPSKKDVRAAYSACVKAKKEASTSEVNKTEETKTEDVKTQEQAAPAAEEAPAPAPEHTEEAK